MQRRRRSIEDWSQKNYKEYQVKFVILWVREEYEMWNLSIGNSKPRLHNLPTVGCTQAQTGQSSGAATLGSA